MGKNRHRAITNYRDYDGVTRRVERSGRSPALARDRLRRAIRDRGRADAAAEITPDTKVTAVAELWFTEIEEAVAEGRRSPNTSKLYRDRLDNQVLPALGELRVREISVSRVDRLVSRTKQNHGVATAKAVRTVVSGVLGLAVRYDALTQNPFATSPESSRTLVPPGHCRSPRRRTFGPASRPTQSPGPATSRTSRT